MKKTKYICLILCVIILGTMVSCADNQKTANSGLPFVFGNVAQPGVENAPPVEVILEITLPTGPTQLEIYRIIKPTVDDKYADDLAERLGFQDPVPLVGTNRSVYSYKNAEETLEINLDGSISMYRKPDMVIPGSLPSEQESINIARDWLKTHNLYPGNVSGVKTAPYHIIDGKPQGVGVVFTVNIKDYILHGLGAYVVVGEKGAILRASLNNPTLEKYSVYNLKPSSAASNILKNYLASSSASPPEAKECRANLRDFARLVVKEISIEYCISEGYMLPVYAFGGDAYFNSGDIEEFVGLVDAVAR
jgi:hypothetical protein